MKALKKVFITVGCLALLLTATGCRTNMSVSFGNAATSKVWITSLQSGKEVEVSPKSFKNLPHGAGDIIVRTQSNERFRFDNISAFHVDAKYRDAHGSIFGFSSVVLTVRLETNMQLYAVLPGKRKVDDKVEQPKGYPKTGEKLNE